MIEAIAQRVGVAIQAEKASFEAALDQLPLGQKRTSTNKAYVRIGEGVVFKGPYRRASLRLINNLRYPFLLRRLEDALDLPEAARGAQPWDRLHVAPGAEGPRYYLAAENVGSPERMCVREASTRVDEAFRVVERRSMVRRVLEVEQEMQRARNGKGASLEEQVAVATLQHLYLRFLLRIGDSGSHNILVRERGSGPVIAGIDFDDHRNDRTPRTIWECLFKGGPSSRERLYGRYLERVVPVEAVPATVAAALEELNALCAAWGQCLPTARRGEALVSAEAIRHRIALAESLWPGPRGLPPAGAAIDPPQRGP